MLFMIIEHFQNADIVPVYKKLKESGRSLPDEIRYVDSWVDVNCSRCFQLVSCNDAKLLQQWILQWRGTGASFEVVPVISSQDTQQNVAPYLEEDGVS